jgi:hypothetical protein
MTNSHLRRSKADVSRAVFATGGDLSLIDGGLDVLDVTTTPRSSSSSFILLMAVRFSVDRAFDADTSDNGRGLLR